MYLATHTIDTGHEFSDSHVMSEQHGALKIYQLYKGNSMNTYISIQIIIN